MVKVNGLFLDYDGTLSPLDVPRPESKVPPHLEAILNVIRKSTRIGIITTKDLPFILPRTQFAYAWSAIAGMEMKVGSQHFVNEDLDSKLSSLIEALIYAKLNAKPGLVIEEKCDHRGLPLAFCVDWRQIKDERAARETYEPILAHCKTFPIKIVEYPGKPFFDVYYRSIDKGQALNGLKDKLSLSDGILYMGDSITDNAAFKAADISIGVATGKKPNDLNCQYWIKFDDVAYFFSLLLKNQLIFNSGLPGIKSME